MLLNRGSGVLRTLIKYNLTRTFSVTTTANSATSFQTLSVNQTKPYVYHVELNRPDKLNAFNQQLWKEIGECFNELNNNPDCRAIVLSGAGKMFTSGLDLNDTFLLAQLAEIEDVGRRGRALNKTIKSYQDSLSSLEICAKPVIAAIHNACIGAGLDLITAADIRYCSDDAWFSIMEVNVGLAADVGTLQRFPKIINSQSLARELCLTGRKFDSKEAYSCGLVSKTFKTKDEMVADALKLAEDIAKKSPIAVQTTKESMVYSLDHTNQEGLDHIRLQNQLALLSEDFINALMAQATKGDPPEFQKL